MLASKRILLGITGGIAAYKTTFLTRLLIKAGAEVRIVMTESAGHFVSPLTLATLSRHEVLTDFVREEDGATDWNNHVELALWADLMLIAPATANTLSKMASGTCDNLLMACYLSAKCPVFFAPAMDLDMYKHPTTRTSLEKLEAFGNTMIPATSGELASGLEGEGRMAEPEEIVRHLEESLLARLPWRGKHVLITAGPTFEPIDPVRFIGNHSSGKMGFELARAAASWGARVTLVSGPSQEQANHPLITCLRVQTASDMLEAAQSHFSDADVVIGAAAVSDYRPAETQEQKIKKTAETLRLDLVKNPDIIQTLASGKQGQFVVGFALETENEEENAREKLRRKQLDAIVLNSLRDPGAGFGGDRNKVSFIDKNSGIKSFELKSKADVARDILREIDARISK
ncbi:MULTISPECIES: bifunctional phosphopantothenoylcysteine decarboxylase/phosphopantothenate--cysteine ligase CoaBC [Robiginitalea]|uniref:Coenzyme A biosynthesis bifunctional protein CoaBC n=1 Tax=Robiginitalea biformata (strain ATCC BAA-864 / DSM 15991 / KCTC 12146 / HTCC2501) TaxID=313596 RepID=A4CLV1_ROBBH|nr:MULTISPECIES: bifunctional phosphopantothenoylcysteine decarboxylase/phosphopantothenate--cysteine ligase CoaBC [Robiginitalea]EAR15850.1 flavoprotein [Robiginitalea biformata HTCC2501]MDC6354273.1 bifunctional phosphopantothenoylcysteine decarboxylase/phosphopantothenate--cysteine ligase CoaBC [Robiginitalea sp. PM2]MDC6374540.1 bifunctional phosphopantothenoylcysteine decarboxylase/phosphopantothenate--cysteine ligase CoaBC [Robiginitalea sp. SP8]